jgi:cytoskeleton-associated protein 5
MQELQTEFDKLDLNGADKPRQTRFLRSQQDLKQKMEQTQASTTVSSSVAAEDVNIESKRKEILYFELIINLNFYFLVQEDLDPFEMLEAVNILDRLPKDFFDKIVMLNNNRCINYYFFFLVLGIKTMERTKRSFR